MNTAVIGFIGVLIGLAVGRGYRFWAERRGELAEAVVAAAILGEELTALQQGAGSGSAEKVDAAWREHRCWMVIHMSPSDFSCLARSIGGIVHGSEAADLGDSIQKMDALHRLFWEEHEALILIPLIHYLKGDTVSKRIHAVLDARRDADKSGSGRGSSALHRWHSPAG